MRDYIDGLTEEIKEFLEFNSYVATGHYGVTKDLDDSED